MKNKHHKIYILLFLIVIFSFILGCAYLNSSLFINGTSIVSANVWEVGLDNLNIAFGSVAAIKEPVTNDEIASISFEVKLDNKEDFYEFTVDVVNRGEHDAKLGSLVETTGLSSEQEQYFDYALSYQNSEPIIVNQLVKKDEFVRIKIKVKYKDNVDVSQVPESAKNLNLGFKLNYDLDDGTGIAVKDNGVKIIPIANGSLDDIGTIVTIGTEKFYTIGTEGDNVKLLSMMNITLDDNPIQSSNAGTTVFSSDEKKGTNYSDYNGSIVEMYVNNYKVLLEKNYSAEIEEARLISYDELSNPNTFECIEENAYCGTNYPWIYSTSYWSGSNKSNVTVYRVHSPDWINTGMYTNHSEYGVRPVIVMLKDDISKETFNFIIDDVTYQAEVGMTWDEWIDSKYNVDKFTLTYNGSCSDGLGEYYGSGYMALQLSSGSLIDNSKIYSFNYILEPPINDTVGICIKK